MDPFGIISAQLMALRLFEDASRGSGRSTMIVQNMMDDDVALVLSEDTKRHYLSLAREMGKKIDVIVIKEFNDLASMNIRYRYGLPPNARIHLDHALVYDEVYKLLQDLDRTVESIQGERRVASNPMNVARLVRGA